jgi:hypothetical protein
MGQFPLFVDNIFTEVPARRLTVPAVLDRVSEPFIDRRFFAALNVYFFKQRKRHPVIFLAKRSDIRSSARFLVQEIIAWETQDDDLVFVGFLEFFPIGILLGETAFGRHVQYDDLFSFVLFQGYRFAVK